MRVVFINTAMRNPSTDKPQYSIGTVAEILNVSVESIRLYERKGLLLTAKGDHNRRTYSDADVERLRCIRTAINEQKISIEGIRRIHALIPCWKHLDCPMKQRLQCPAYRRNIAGCWTYRHEGNVCAARDCQACIVYHLSADCERIKFLIHNIDPATLADPAHCHQRTDS